MGMFDTIYFDKNYKCPLCQGKINSIQVKEFENLLESFHIKDCISHAEDIRIIKDELFCTNCLKSTGIKIFIVVNRGILVGVVDSLEEGKKLLDDLNFEKLVLWYHDQFKINKKIKIEKNRYRKFLSELQAWFGEKLYENPPTDLEAIRYTENISHLKGAKGDPVEAIERFLSYDKMIKTLDELWDEGHETLDIYFAEDISPGEEKWFVDVYQDELNERCSMNWTWTVINRKDLEEDEKEEEVPEWEIVVDVPFSEQVVKDSIYKWLNDRGYKFEVRLIPLEEAKGSGSIKELRERLKNLDKEEYIKIEDIDWNKFRGENIK